MNHSAEQQEIADLEPTMREALEKGDYELFSRLERKRSSLMHELTHPGTDTFPSGVINSLISRSRELIEISNNERLRLQAELANVMMARNSSKQVTEAYDAHSSSGRYIDGNG